MAQKRWPVMQIAVPPWEFPAMIETAKAQGMAVSAWGRKWLEHGLEVDGPPVEGDHGVIRGTHQSPVPGQTGPLPTPASIVQTGGTNTGTPAVDEDVPMTVKPGDADWNRMLFQVVGVVADEPRPRSFVATAMHEDHYLAVETVEALIKEAVRRKWVVEAEIEGIVWLRRVDKPEVAHG